MSHLSRKRRTLISGDEYGCSNALELETKCQIFATTFTESVVDWKFRRRFLCEMQTDRVKGSKEEAVPFLLLTSLPSLHKMFRSKTAKKYRSREMWANAKNRRRVRCTNDTTLPFLQVQTSSGFHFFCKFHFVRHQSKVCVLVGCNCTGWRTGLRTKHRYSVRTVLYVSGFVPSRSHRSYRLSSTRSKSVSWQCGFR